jgi:hypothetical protein
MWSWELRAEGWPPLTATKDRSTVDRNERPPDQPTQAQPQPNRILAEPATVDQCKADYQAAADVRGRLGWKDGQS